MTMRVPELAVPLFAALGQVPEGLTPGELPEGAPQWLAAFMAGAFMVVWMLDRYDKLPGATPRQQGGGTSVSLGSDERARIAQTVLDADERKRVAKGLAQVGDVHRVVTREDAANPGRPLVWGYPLEEHRQLRLLMKDTHEIAKGFAGIAENMDRTTRMHVTTMQAIQQGLASASLKLNDVEAKLDHLAGRIGGGGP